MIYICLVASTVIATCNFILYKTKGYVSEDLWDFDNLIAVQTTANLRNSQQHVNAVSLNPSNNAPEPEAATWVTHACAKGAFMLLCFWPP